MNIQKLKGKNLVVTDVRFKNEIEWMKSKGGVLLEVRRGFKPTWYTIAAEANRGSIKAEEYMLNESGIHESEWRWIGHSVDHVIDNDSDLNDLKNKISNILLSYVF